MQMRKKSVAGVEIKSGGIDEACSRYGLGKASIRRIAEEAGAVIHVGKRLLFNFSKIDSYLDSISE